MGNSNHVAVSISPDFPSNFNGDATFHGTAFDYYQAD